jgi:hypothetical protein
LWINEEESTGMRREWEYSEGERMIGVVVVQRE